MHSLEPSSHTEERHQAGDGSIQICTLHIQQLPMNLPVVFQPCSTIGSRHLSEKDMTSTRW